MMRESMAIQIEVNEDMKNRVVKLERQINQGLRNRHAIIKNLERQVELLEKKILHTEPIPRTTNTKQIHEIVYNPPSIQNENDNGDVKFIKEEIKLIPTILMKEKVFKHDVLSNQVDDEELNSFDGVGIGGLKEKEIKNDGKASNGGGCWEQKSIDLTL
nr:hypothetical protein [Tanacetum cinerariifolium]